MINYGKQSLDDSDINEVISALKTDWLTQGPAVENFENNLKEYFGADYVCAVSNGTAALHLAALSLNFKKDDIILTSPITFLASANCIEYVGATPDFVDIDPFYYTIDPNKIEDKIKSLLNDGKRPKGIIGVDYAGHPCDWEAINQIATKYEMKLINDNCHALGATYLGDKGYAVKYANIATHSYHPVKPITTGEGGSILTNEKDIYEKVKTLRSHGMTKEPERLEENHGPWYYEMHEIGYNYRITDFQCTLGSSQLKKLDNFTKRRNDIAEKYNSLFKAQELITIPEKSSAVQHAYHLYPIKIHFDKLSITKKEFFNELNTLGINSQVHYIPVHLQPYYKKKYGFKKGDFELSEDFYDKALSIPIYPLLEDNQVEEVAKKINSLLESKKL